MCDLTQFTDGKTEASGTSLRCLVLKLSLRTFVPGPKAGTRES